MQTVWSCTLSVSVCQSDQMLCLHTVRWRFMSQGASGLRGYHIMRMMALLSWVPYSKTEGAGAARWVAGIPNILPHSKDNSFVALSWMSCHFREKHESNPFISYPSVTVWISHKLFVSIQGMMASDVVPSDRTDGRVDASVALRPSDKEGDVTVLTVVRSVMYSALYTWRLLVWNPLNPQLMTVGTLSLRVL